MGCFSSSNRSHSPTRQHIRSIYVDAQNLNADIRQAYNNGAHVGALYGRCGHLLLELQQRIGNRSGHAPDVFRNQLSDIQSQYNSIINPLSHSIQNNQSSSSSGQEREFILLLSRPLLILRLCSPAPILRVGLILCVCVCVSFESQRASAAWSGADA